MNFDARSVRADGDGAATGSQDAPERLAVRVARLLLLLALACGVWFVCERLPDAARRDAASARPAAAPATLLRIVRSVPDSDARGGAELYSIDTAAAERRFRAERRAGVSFDDYVRERSGRRPPLAARFDETGAATLRVAPGRWWVHARASFGDEELTWRLPVNVIGRELTVALTRENVYTRSQSY